jgi:hypothetical protein
MVILDGFIEFLEANPKLAKLAKSFGYKPSKD